MKQLVNQQKVLGLFLQQGRWSRCGSEHAAFSSLMSRGVSRVSAVSYSKVVAAVNVLVSAIAAVFVGNFVTPIKATPGVLAAVSAPLMLPSTPLKSIE